MTGLIYVFTGDGKGKTSAAIGVATRALLIGKQVGWVAFYKGKDWEVAEKKLGEKFNNLTMVFSGEGFRIRNEKKMAGIAEGKIVVDRASEKEHQKGARRGMEQGREMLKEKPFLLVMDEVLNAVSEGLVEEEEVIRLLEERGETHVVLTGRGATKRIITMSDLVTECKKIKHPYDKGKLAMRGLDY
ncbi:MAG: cob(I)yrinic acid a,c-diamide adenosyltransferase [bacterium]